jgi:hypothetical protein
MVKIPTYDSTFKKRTLVKDTYSGFSGGEIQVASQRANIDFKSLAGTIDKYEKVKQEREGKVWLSKSKSDLKIWMTNEEIRIKKENPNLDGEGHTKMMIDSFKKKSDELKKTAPNEWASSNWEISHNEMLSTTYSESTLYEAQKTVEADEEKINEAAKSATEASMLKPHTITEQIEDLEKIFDTWDDKKTPEIEGMAGRINAAVLKEKKNAVIGKMIKDTIETIIQRGDELEIEMAKKWLTNKYYTKYLEVDDQQSLTKQLDSKKKEVGGQFISDTEDMIESNLNSIKSTGVVQHDKVLERIIAINGPDSKAEAEYKKKVIMAKTMFNNKKELSLKTEKDQNEMIAEWREKAKTGDNDTKLIYENLIKDKQQFETLLKEDPIEWAKEYRPDLYKRLTSEIEVGIGIETADGQEFSGDATAIRTLAYRELIDMQQKWGIASWDAKIWSKADAAMYAAKINNTNNAMEAKIYIEMLKKDHGEYWEIGLNQMVQGKFLDGKWIAAIQYIDDPEFETIINRGVLNIVDEKTLNSADVKAIKDDIIGNFSEISAALTSTNANAGEFVENWQELVTNYAINLHRAGDKNAAKNAFKKLVENKFHISEGYLIPITGTIDTGKGYKVQNTLTKDEYDTALTHFIENNIDTESLIPLQSGSVLDEIGEYNDEYYKGFNKDNYKENVVWRNTADGQGLELIWSNDFGQWPVGYETSGMDTGDEKTTKSIFLSWDDLNKYAIASMERTDDDNDDPPGI